jgi:hypothetical protein
VILLAVVIALNNEHAKNATPYNNQQNTFKDNITNGPANVNNSIQQLTSTLPICSRAEWNGGGKTCFGWWTAGPYGTGWSFPNDADTPAPPLHPHHCGLAQC